MTSNSRFDTLKSRIVGILSSCGENEALKRKTIRSKCINGESQLDDLNKSEVKKALRELVKSGRVKELSIDGSSRYMMCSNNDPKSSSGSASDSSSDERDADDDNVRDEALPFAELMRKRQEKMKGNGVKTSASEKASSEVEEKEDTDEEIRRLEAELAADSNDDDSSDYSEGSGDESALGDEMEGKSSKKRISFGPSTEYVDERMKRNESEGSIIRSNLEAERIAPLPKSALPQMKKRKLKGIDGDVSDDGNSSKKKKKKGKQAGSHNAENKEVNDGLREAVKEVLSGYEARSHERIPFYCRVCSVQSKDMESFLAHKNTDFHKAAVKAERKATYCQACRKQFTSPVQMEEHLNSKPHHERMFFLRSKSQGVGGRGGRGSRGGSWGRGRLGGRGRFGRGDRGYGGRGGRDSRAASNRQWC